MARSGTTRYVQSVCVLDESSGREWVTLQDEELAFSWRAGDEIQGRMWGR